MASARTIRPPAIPDPGGTDAAGPGFNRKSESEPGSPLQVKWFSGGPIAPGEVRPGSRSRWSEGRALLDLNVP
jgi:hypothetical protein